MGKKKAIEYYTLQGLVSPSTISNGYNEIFIPSMKSLSASYAKYYGQVEAVMLVYGGIKFAMAFRHMDQQGEHLMLRFIPFTVLLVMQQCPLLRYFSSLSLKI